MTTQESGESKELRELKQKQRLHDLRADVLYVAGALLVSVGLALPVRIERSLIAAGCFCLMLPVCELITGFVRGLRRGGGSRPQV